jgi:hypothetical protein
MTSSWSLLNPQSTAIHVLFAFEPNRSARSAFGLGQSCRGDLILLMNVDGLDFFRHHDDFGSVQRCDF